MEAKEIVDAIEAQTKAVLHNVRLTTLTMATVQIFNANPGRTPREAAHVAAELVKAAKIHNLMSTDTEDVKRT